MIKNIIVPLSLLWVISASAQYPALKPIFKISNEFKIPLALLSEPVRIMDVNSCDYLKPVTLPIDPSTPGPIFSPLCVNFINASGNLGPYGKEIRNYLLEAGNQNENFFRNEMPGMVEDPGVCPKWSKFTINERILFWVWMMTSIAHAESSCDATKVNMGKVIDPSDRPRGLFQLNTRKAKRAWRGPNCGFPSEEKHVYNPRNNIRCSMDIMDEILKGKQGEYESNGKIYPTNSYWRELRPKIKPAGGKIGKLMKTFPLCN